MKLDGTHYDGDKLRALANRDTPAAVVARAAIRVSDSEQITEPADVRATAARD